MTKVTLEIQDDADLQLLLSLLERLKINHWVNGGESAPALSVEERREHYRIIDKGAPSSDFEERIKNLDEDRQDRKLPFRED